MLVFGLVSLAFPVSVWGVDRSRGAMDQAALQRVTLARSSGTLCWTAWGAREQQSLRTLIGFCFCGSEAILLAHSLGEWCSSEFPG